MHPLVEEFLMVKFAIPKWQAMLNEGRLGRASIGRLAETMGLNAQHADALANKFTPGFNADIPILHGMGWGDTGASTSRVADQFARGQYWNPSVVSRFVEARAAMRPTDLASLVGDQMAGRINTMPLSQPNRLRMASIVRDTASSRSSRMNMDSPAFLQRPILEKPHPDFIQPGADASEGQGFMSTSEHPEYQRLSAGEVLEQDSPMAAMYPKFSDRLKGLFGASPPRPWIMSSGPAVTRHEMGHWLNARMTPATRDSFLASLSNRMQQHDPTFLERFRRQDYDNRYPHEMMANYLGARPTGVGGRRLINYSLRGGYTSPGVEAMPNDRLKATMAQLEKNYRMPKTLDAPYAKYTRPDGSYW